MTFRQTLSVVSVEVESAIMPAQARAAVQAAETVDSARHGLFQGGAVGDIKVKYILAGDMFPQLPTLFITAHGTRHPRAQVTGGAYRCQPDARAGPGDEHTIPS